jgi:hypothetical protein
MYRILCVNTLTAFVLQLSVMILVDIASSALYDSTLIKEEVETGRVGEI